MCFKARNSRRDKADKKFQGQKTCGQAFLNNAIKRNKVREVPAIEGAMGRKLDPRDQVMITSIQDLKDHVFAARSNEP